jgi:hypothetical protein
MAKWKVYAHKSPIPSYADMIVRMTGMGSGSVLALSAYMIERIGNVMWEDIPAELTEQSSEGWRFVEIRPELTIDDFEIVLLEM